MVDQSILNSERKTIEGRIASVAFTHVHVVSGEDDFLTEQPVVKHEQRSIEELELVIPKNVKDARLRRGGVSNQSYVIDKNPEDSSS
jgi:hypothetical protein